MYNCLGVTNDIKVYNIYSDSCGLLKNNLFYFSLIDFQKENMVYECKKKIAPRVVIILFLCENWPFR